MAQKLSELVQAQELALDVDLSRPPEGTWHRGTGMETVIGASHRSLGGALGMLAVTLFWNGIVSVFVAVALSSTLGLLGVQQPDWMPDPVMNGSAMGIGITLFLWLFLTPFILIGIAFFLAFITCLWGRTEVRVTPVQTIVYSGIGAMGRTRRVDSSQITSVRIRKEEWHTSKGRRRTKEQIVVERTDGPEIKFGSSLGETKMKFVAGALRHALGM